MPEQQNDAKRILFHEYGMQLRTGEGDALIFNVLCGRVGQYGVEFQLNAEERDGYKREGDAFLRKLDLAVRENPKSYGLRGRFC